MSSVPFALDTLTELCLRGYVDYPRLAALASEVGLAPPALLDALSLRTAEAYAAGRVSYDDADFLMNTVAELMFSPEFIDAHHQPPALALSAYLAFDAGEYQRKADPADLDPVRTYTDPLVRELLQGL